MRSRRIHAPCSPALLTEPVGARSLPTQLPQGSRSAPQRSTSPCGELNPSAILCHQPQVGCLAAMPTPASRLLRSTPRRDQVCPHKLPRSGAKRSFRLKPSRVMESAAITSVFLVSAAKQDFPAIRIRLSNFNYSPDLTRAASQRSLPDSGEILRTERSRQNHSMDRYPQPDSNSHVRTRSFPLLRTCGEFCFFPLSRKTSVLPLLFRIDGADEALGACPRSPW